MDMSQRIKERRLAMGLTQEGLATRLGLQKSAIAKYENGRVENIKRSVIAKMSGVLQCSPAYLMGWDDSVTSLPHKTLRPDESQLLNNYNLLNDTGKEKAQDSVHDLTEIKRYRKDNKVTSFPVLNAAHERTDIDVTDEMLQHDDDIMDNDDEW